jgi:hypothetical protein
MAVTYELHGGILRLNFEGTYEPKDIIDQFVAAMKDPRCPAQVALLLDVTRSDVLHTRSPEEIRHVAEYLGPYRERIGGRVAVIAARDVHFGFGSMGRAYSAGVGVEAGIFRDAKAALEWLGVGSRVPAPDAR